MEHGDAGASGMTAIRSALRGAGLDGVGDRVRRDDHARGALDREVAELEAEHRRGGTAPWRLSGARSCTVTTIGTGHRSRAPSIHGEWNRPRSGAGSWVSTTSHCPRVAQRLEQAPGVAAHTVGALRGAAVEGDFHERRPDDALLVRPADSNRESPPVSTNAKRCYPAISDPASVRSGDQATTTKTCGSVSRTSWTRRRSTAPSRFLLGEVRRRATARSTSAARRASSRPRLCAQARDAIGVDVAEAALGGRAPATRSSTSAWSRSSGERAARGRARSTRCGRAR